MERSEKIIKIHKPNLDEKVFFFGMGVTISVPLTLFVYQYTDILLLGLDPFLIAFFSRVIFAPFVEEFAKVYPLFYRHGETEKAIFDLSLIVGLGFGIVEFFTYIFVLEVPLIFRIPGVLFHPASTAIIGYGVAKKRPMPYYLIAVMLHLTNNFVSLTNPNPLIGSVLVVSITVIIAWYLQKDVKENVLIQ
jgi:RsiW-degrading membrane proteinase PrsW (M82 family)